MRPVREKGVALVLDHLKTAAVIVVALALFLWVNAVPIVDQRPIEGGRSIIRDAGPGVRVQQVLEPMRLAVSHTPEPCAPTGVDP
jgi:hypothetical protein